MKHVVAAAAAAASISIVFKLWSTLRELQNAARLLQRSAEKLITVCEKETVEIAAENVSAGALVSSTDERHEVTDVNVMINNIAHTYDTATKTARDVHAMMLKAIDTNDVARKISQDVNAVMLKTDENVKALQLMSQSFQQTHDTISALPATINTTAEKYSTYLHNEHELIMAACSKK